MRLPSPHQTPLLRSFAAAALLVWVAAQVFCADLCTQATTAVSGQTSHCHAEAAASHHHDGDSQEPNHDHRPCAASPCQTLKQALLTGKAPLNFYPPSLPLYTLAPFAPTLNDIAPVVHAKSRHAIPPDWVLTPEVCLGPAFRSLAPPALPLA